MTQNNTTNLTTAHRAGVKLSTSHLDNNETLIELIRQLFEELGKANMELITRSKENIKIDNKL
jgi:hypothetical protein